MSSEVQKNMAIIRNFFEMINRNDHHEMLTGLEKLITEDYILHDPAFPEPLIGRKNCVEYYRSFYDTIENLQIKVEDIFGMDDKVVTRLKCGFTEKSSQERNLIDQIIISRFVNGEVAEEWQVEAMFKQKLSDGEREGSASFA